jgi:hypothetical protein
MTPPDMEYVDSSNVEAIGFDEDANEIHVQFHGGRTYVYAETDLATYEDLRDADSIGSYLNRVLKPNFPCREL